MMYPDFIKEPREYTSKLDYDTTVKTCISRTHSGQISIKDASGNAIQYTAGKGEFGLGEYTLLRAGDGDNPIQISKKKDCAIIINDPSLNVLYTKLQYCVHCLAQLDIAANKVDERIHQALLLATDPNAINANIVNEISQSLYATCLHGWVSKHEDDYPPYFTTLLEMCEDIRQSFREKLEHLESRSRIQFLGNSHDKIASKCGSLVACYEFSQRGARDQVTLSFMTPAIRMPGEEEESPNPLPASEFSFCIFLDDKNMTFELDNCIYKNFYSLITHMSAKFLDSEHISLRDTWLGEILVQASDAYDNLNDEIAFEGWSNATMKIRHFIQVLSETLSNFSYYGK